jgi:hypothetical protein
MAMVAAKMDTNIKDLSSAGMVDLSTWPGVNMNLKIIGWLSGLAFGYSGLSRPAEYENCTRACSRPVVSIYEIMRSIDCIYRG